MFNFFKKNPVLGIEITSAAVRVAAFSGNRGHGRLISAADSQLQPGIVTENYGTVNIHDSGRLLSLLGSCLDQMAPKGKKLRAGLSLPDGIFRVQTLEFDTLPSKAAERERLIRWRLEKSAALDLSDTLLRHHVTRGRDGRYAVIASVAKKPVIAQYEGLLAGTGIEPWHVGPSSFSILNFYDSYLAGKSSSFALIHFNGDSFTTIISVSGCVRFYRYKEIKRGSGDNGAPRLLREIDDSLHFYLHMGRSNQTEIENLYLCGDQAVCGPVAGELRACTTMNIEVLSPEVVLHSRSAAPEMSAALGAGRSV